MQLVNLARLRIMATQLDIPLVRCDDEDYLRISVGYGLQDWLKIQAKLPAKLGKKLRWVAAVATRSDSKPTLLCKAELMDGTEQVKFLLELFKALMKIAGIDGKGESKPSEGPSKKDAGK